MAHQAITDELRQAIWLETEQQFDYMFTGYRDALGVYRLDRCLHWALAAIMAIRKLTGRTDLMILGGTANFWANGNPDPAASTHVGYFWQEDTDPDPEKWLGVYELPEVHCWAFLRDSYEIIDPSVKFIHTVAIRNGIAWTRPVPTEGLWCNVNDIPEGWFYIPDVNATKLVNALAHNVLIELREAEQARKAMGIAL